MEIRIDPEFKDKIPPLTDAEFRQLEDNIVKDGQVISPIIIWNGLMVDGHNRWEIIQRHPEIPYIIKEMEFTDRYEVIVWICRNQLGRRNLTDEQKTYLIGKQYEAQKQSESFHGNQYSKPAGGQNVSHQPTKTRDIIAREHGVSSKSVARAEKFAHGIDTAEKLSPGFKDAILRGEVKAPKKVIASISSMPEPEQKKAVKAITNNKDFSAREMGRLFDALTSGMTEEKEIPYSAENLEEELRALVSDFKKKFITTLTIRKELLSEERAIKKANAVLSEAETAIKELRGFLKHV